LKTGSRLESRFAGKTIEKTARAAEIKRLISGYGDTREGRQIGATCRRCAERSGVNLARPPGQGKVTRKIEKQLRRSGRGVCYAGKGGFYWETGEGLQTGWKNLERRIDPGNCIKKKIDKRETDFPAKL